MDERDGHASEGCLVRALDLAEVTITHMAAQIVKLSLTQDRMVQDLAVLRGGSLQAVRNYYGIGEK